MFYLINYKFLTLISTDFMIVNILIIYSIYIYIDEHPALEIN